MDDLVLDLRGLLDAALRRGEIEAIHDARVATRRIKAALDVLEPALGRSAIKHLRKATRRLRRTLGPLRDSDVMLAQLEPGLPTPEGSEADSRWEGEGGAIAPIGTVAEPGVLPEMPVAPAEAAPSQEQSPELSATARLAADLTRQRAHLHRQARRNKFIRQLDEGLARWPDLRAEISQMSEAIEPLIATAVHERLDALQGHAAALISDEAEPANVEAEAKRDTHALRLAGKRLRYTLELARAQGMTIPDDGLKLFKRMQSALGDWHDAALLAQRSVSDAAEEQLAYHDDQAFIGFLQIAHDAVGRAMSRLDDFAQMWRQHGPALAQKLREAFVIAQPVAQDGTKATNPSAEQSDGAAESVTDQSAADQPAIQ
jgi:CHAD domain-containing protein